MILNFYVFNHRPSAVQKCVVDVADSVACSSRFCLRDLFQNVSASVVETFPSLLHSMRIDCTQRQVYISSNLHIGCVLNIKMTLV